MPSKAQIAAYTTVAENALAMCRKIQPDFWNPENNPGMADAWGYVFANKPFPPACYYEAVGVFYAEDSTGQRPTPGQIAHYARVVRDRWETDPIKRVELRQHRELMEAERDKQLAEGTFGLARGYQPRQIESHRPPPAGLDALLQAVGNTPPEQGTTAPEPHN